MYDIEDLTRQQALKRIAILTSGGDAPGMNAAIRASVRAAHAEGIEVFGVLRGYSGLVADEMRRMEPASVANILQRGGTLLKSDRCDAFRDPEVRRRVTAQLRARGIEALIVIGGDGSLTGAMLLQQETGFPVIGLPGTIDNDVFGTDDSIGFDTAVDTALGAIDRIRDTANSHDRLFLVEVMGRASGFIAAYVGIAGGAEFVLTPERPLDIAYLAQHLRDSQQAGKTSSLIVVAEGREPGRTQELAAQLAAAGFEPRVCILGHTQRGGAPTGHDRMLASYLGAMAVRYLLAGRSNLMIGVDHQRLVAVPLATVVQGHKSLPPRVLEMAELLQRRSQAPSP